jgi:catechol 2,3-dioxygenase-like lactoylglutathione lyase family enzyme
MTGVGLDHVVVVVSSLAEATARFSSAGFTVTPGGRHEGLPTENALVAFADGAYLELLAAREAATRTELRALRASDGWDRHLKGVSAIARRFLPALAGADGVADWGATGGALGPRAATLRALGVKASGPLAMSRERADGVRLEWEMLLPESRLHPFWVADRTPRPLRAPGSTVATSHANGATGIAAVRLRTPHVPTAALELGESLGVAPRLTGRTTTLALGSVRVEVVDGEPEGPCGVALSRCAPLPDALAALGVTAEP